MDERISLERMAYGAQAVGHLASGKTVFVEGGAPGDTCTIEIFEEKPSFARARIKHLDEASPLRVPLRWTEPAACGVLPWQHLSYIAQLSAKRNNVVAALSRIGGVKAERAEKLVAPCLPSAHEWAYRNKIELGCTCDKRGLLQLGFHDDGASEVLVAQHCPVAHTAIENAPKALSGALRFAQGADNLGIYRVGVRHSVATGALEIALWTPPSAFPRAHVAHVLEKSLKTSGIVRVMADPGHARKVKGIEVLSGKSHWEEELSGFRFSVAAPSFFQVNTAQAETLIEEVLRGLNATFDDNDADDNGAPACAPDSLYGLYIADLYAGCGTFSVPLAAAGADVVAVESAASSVRDLRHNAHANAVELDVLGGDAARELPDLGKLDALVVDPPRAGLADSMPAAIAKAHPARVVYVSCNPQTLARDVARLQAFGYRLVHAQPIDMFPQTYHVEVVSAFEQKCERTNAAG